MVYCLVCTECSDKWEIQCILRKRPHNHQAMRRGVQRKYVVIQKGPNQTDGEPFRDCEGKLEIDWKATGTGLRQINWPRIEDLK